MYRTRHLLTNGEIPMASFATRCLSDLSTTTDLLHHGTKEWYRSTAETTEYMLDAEKPRRRRSPYTLTWLAESPLRKRLLLGDARTSRSLLLDAVANLFGADIRVSVSMMTSYWELSQVTWHWQE